MISFVFIIVLQTGEAFIDPTQPCRSTADIGMSVLTHVCSNDEVIVVVDLHLARYVLSSVPTNNGSQLFADINNKIIPNCKMYC